MNIVINSRVTLTTPVPTTITAVMMATITVTHQTTTINITLNNTSHIITKDDKSKVLLPPSQKYLAIAKYGVT